MTGNDVLESSLGQVPAANVANFASRSATVDKLKTVGCYKKVSSSASNADEATARTAAIGVPLISGIGSVSLYWEVLRRHRAKAGPGRRGARSWPAPSENGVIMEGDDYLPGNPFLDTGTAEDARQLDKETANQNAATVNETEFVFNTPGGLGINGLTGISVKTRNAPGRRRPVRGRRRLPRIHRCYRLGLST